VTSLRSTRSAEDLLEVQGEMVVVTVKQYLAVADDVLRKLFPELPASFWAHSGQYPYCSVHIKDDDSDSPLQ
jgi:phage gp37-like protein